MTEAQAKQVVHTAGWTPRTRQLPRSEKWYLYAYRKKQGKLEERYIAPVEGLERMTEEDIVKKLS